MPSAPGRRRVASVTFFVPGIPKSAQTGSVVRAGKRLIPIRRGTAWSSLVGLVARQYAPPEPLDGPLRVWLGFRFNRPKSSRRAYPTVRPDADNLIKGLMDSLNGVLWVDDAQIVELRVTKDYFPTQQGLRITVETLA